MLFGPAAIKQIWKVLNLCKGGPRKIILGLVKRCLNNNVPQFLKNYFKLNKEVISRETRRSNFIYLPAVRTETAKKSFYYNGSVVYNNYLVNKN